MPGTKIELKVGEDPDPAPFLFVSQEIKERIAAKVYDPKRSAYVPHPEEKFAEVIFNLFSQKIHENCFFVGDDRRDEWKQGEGEDHKGSFGRRDKRVQARAGHTSQPAQV